MVKMDFIDFLEKADDYLIPPAMPLGLFPSETAEKIMPYRGIKSRDVDVSTFQKFVSDIGAYECLEGDMWKGRSAHTVRAIAEEIMLHREEHDLQLTPSNLMACFTLGWAIQACSTRSVPTSKLCRVIGDLPGVWINGRFSPNANGLPVFNFLMEGGLKYWRLIETFQQASYRQIPLMIGGLLRLKGWSAADVELDRLFESVALRPGSRYLVTNAIISSNLPKKLYMQKLSGADKGGVLEGALGL
jgi:hypothetical protein